MKVNVHVTNKSFGVDKVSYTDMRHLMPCKTRNHYFGNLNHNFGNSLGHTFSARNYKFSNLNNN